MLEDSRANDWSLRPCCMVAAYQITHFCSVWCKKNIINSLRATSVLVMYRLITKCLFGYEIRAVASIGRRFAIHHGYGVVINKNMVAGDDLTLRHGATIGNLGANDPSCPVIGSGVELGANVTLFGDVVIGDSATIGVGSAVVDNVLNNMLVVGEKVRTKVVE